MSDEPIDGMEPKPEQMDEVAALLGKDALWAEPSADVESRVLAAIANEARSGTSQSMTADPPSIIGRRSRARSRRGARPMRRRMASLVVAAAVVAVVTSLAIVALRADSDIVTVAMTGSELFPEATATAEVEELPNGARIVLDVSGLPPAPGGRFYAAWVIRDEPASRIGAGTFHMRGGDGTIELWSGVSTEFYPTLAVSLEYEDERDTPGDPILKGRRDG